MSRKPDLLLCTSTVAPAEWEWPPAPPVEKNEDADQKIEQDGTANKPEDKAHKAATKIQASFRGHITRKKMKDGEEEKEKEGDGLAAEEVTNGEEEPKVNGEEKLTEKEETAGEETKKEVEETNQAKSPVADKSAPADTAMSPVAAAPPAASPTAPSEPHQEEPKVEEKAQEKPKEVVAAESPTTATEKEEEQSEQKKEEEARKADVPAAASPTAEKEEPKQTNGIQGTQMRRRRFSGCRMCERLDPSQLFPTFLQPSTADLIEQTR
uniref:Neuromodulin n=1 Tax=Nothobranchius furzeri TaxID=105023 RepID=A0A8C6NYL0_NOTFU